MDTFTLMYFNISNFYNSWVIFFFRYSITFHLSWTQEDWVIIYREWPSPHSNPALSLSQWHCQRDLDMFPPHFWGSSASTIKIALLRVLGTPGFTSRDSGERKLLPPQLSCNTSVTSPFLLCLTTPSPLLPRSTTMPRVTSPPGSLDPCTHPIENLAMLRNGEWLVWEVVVLVPSEGYFANKAVIVLVSKSRLTSSVLSCCLDKLGWITHAFLSRYHFFLILVFLNDFRMHE